LNAIPQTLPSIGIGAQRFFGGSRLLNPDGAIGFGNRQQPTVPTQNGRIKAAGINPNSSIQIGSRSRSLPQLNAARLRFARTRLQIRQRRQTHIAFIMLARLLMNHALGMSHEREFEQTFERDLMVEDPPEYAADRTWDRIPLMGATKSSCCCKSCGTADSGNEN
jgi:hypothetical protein